MRVPSVIAAALVLVGACSLGGDLDGLATPGGADAGTTDGEVTPDGTAAAGTFAIAFDPPDVVVHRGTSASLLVTVTRSPAFTGAVDVALDPSRTPPGVDAAKVTIPAGASSTTFTVSAAADAKQGATTLVANACAGSAPSILATLGVAVAGAAGTPDLSFGNGGTVTLDLGQNEYANAIGVLRDGRVIVGGQASTGNGADFMTAVVAFDDDGVADATFGAGGRALFRVGSSGDSVYALAVRSDGRVVLGGSTHTADASAPSDLELAQVSSSGIVDTSFGRATSITASDDVVRAIAIQPDGKTVTAALVGSYPSTEVAVARWDATGVLDPTFGNAGITRPALTSVADFPEAIALQPDGKIVVAGFSQNAADVHMVISRFTSDGALDATFGGGSGFVVPDVNGAVASSATALLLTPDGRILVGGQARGAADYDIALVRLLADGSLDSTFGTNGAATIHATDETDQCQTLFVGADGKLLVGGMRVHLTSANSVTTTVAFARLLPQGTLDTTFGTNGIVLGTSSNGRVAAATTDRFGRLVAAIYSFNGKDYDFAVARFWP